MMSSIKHYNRFIFIVIFILNSIAAISQTDWETAGTLYSKNGFQVKLLYKLKADSCETNSTKTSKYEYDISGTPKGSDLYLNWKMDYLTCSGLIMTQANSLKIVKNMSGLIVNPEYKFNGYKVIEPFYDVKISTKPNYTPVQLKGRNKSIPPENIIHEEQVFKGDTSFLKIIGGQLGNGANWVWYKDNLNSLPLGKGEQIAYEIQNSCNIYVRAESVKDTSKAIQTFIKVSENSIIAEKIEGQSFFCKGEQKNIKLWLIGGRLGKNAEWKWYKDDCGGKSIGTGRTIEITPFEKAIYFVRAESPTEISTCVSKEIAVTELSKTPKEIIGNSSSCWGESSILSIKGGKLAVGANWVWYEKTLIGNKVIGKGETITVRPESNTVYLVRAEGTCNYTELISKIVSVNTVSKIPDNIETNFGASTNLTKGKYTFSLSGATLSGNSKWVWYKKDDDNSIPEKIGEGNFIKLYFKKKTTLMVRAEGEGFCENEYFKKEFTLSDEKSSTTLSAKIGYSYFNIGLVSSVFSQNSSVSPISPANLVLSYGRIGKEKINWYVRGKYCLKSVDQSDYQSTDNGVIISNNFQPNYTMAMLNGKVTEERYSATFGILLGGSDLKFFLGYGWGKRELKWGINEYQYDSYSNQTNTISTNKWASNTNRYYEGDEIECGFLLKFTNFNIQGGISTISTTSSSQGNKYFDTHLGIGFNF